MVSYNNERNFTLDGCPITPEPWAVRAATFCDDGTPSFEVVMPGSPRMSAVDARVLGAAPLMYAALKKIYFNNEAACGCECDVDTCCARVGEPCAKCDAYVALVGVNVKTPELPVMPKPNLRAVNKER